MRRWLNLEDGAPLPGGLPVGDTELIRVRSARYLDGRLGHGPASWRPGVTCEQGLPIERGLRGVPGTNDRGFVCYM